MSETTEQLLQRATDKINKQAATIRELRGDEDTVGGAITKSLRAGNRVHAVDVIAAEIREGPNNKLSKARETHGAKTIPFGGVNLGDTESFKKSKVERDKRRNPMNRPF